MEPRLRLVDGRLLLLPEKVDSGVGLTLERGKHRRRRQSLESNRASHASSATVSHPGSRVFVHILARPRPFPSSSPRLGLPRLQSPSEILPARASIARTTPLASPRRVRARINKILVRPRSSLPYLGAHVTRERDRRVRPTVHAVRVEVSDVHLHRPLIRGRDQTVRPRALARDVQVHVFSVGVDHRVVVVERRRRKADDRSPRAPSRADTSSFHSIRPIEVSLVFIFPPLFVPITVHIIHTSRIRMLYTPCIDITSQHSPRPHLWTSADARRAAVVTLRCRRVMSASCMSFRASVSGARVSVEVREWVRWIGEKNRRRSFARARRGGRREGRGKEDGWMDARVASAREGSAVISFRRMRGED